MTDRIKRLLADAGIENYLINESHAESVELYFVRRALEQKRGKCIDKSTVTVYRDAVRDGERLRGAGEALIFLDMTDSEIKDKLTCAYASAEYAYAPAYPLCEPSKAHKKEDGSDSLPALDIMARRYSEAIFAEKQDECYVNCAELFLTKTSVRISNSLGLDVSYTECRCDGELVVSSAAGEDSELFDYFSYTGEQYDSLARRVRELLLAVLDRSYATRSLPSGEYSLIIEGDACRELFGYYLWKSDAQNIHTGYSQARIGDALVPSDSVAASITCAVTHPCSREGIPMKDTPLLEDGKLLSYTGGMRFCSYIGAEPTGEYERLCVRAGERSIEDMKKGPYLHVVSFSDFQFDSFDGYFGGEIRLAYLSDGAKVRAVTGGSVSSNISKLQDSATASAETCESYNYSGPRFLMIRGVTVSGSK